MDKRSEKWHEELKAEVLADPAARFEYEMFKTHLELVQALRKARETAGLTQENVAEKMHTKKPVIARLEATGGKDRHSPSLATLLKYSHAIGYKMKIQLVRDKDAT